MNELAVKAANGTNSEDDRSYIQAEVDQLVVEIDRVSTTTKFNETYLLKGTNTNTGKGVGDLTYKTAAGMADFDEDDFDADGIATIAGDDPWEDSGEGSAAAGQIKKASVEINGKTYTYLTSFTKGTGASNTPLKSFDELVSDYKATNSTEIVATSFGDLEKAFKANNAEDVKTVSFGLNSANQLEAKVTAFADLNKAVDLSLHVGADSTKDNKIGLSIDMMSARGLGVNGIRVDGQTDTNATNAIDTIKAAIQKVSEQRSTLGAVQNRLDHTINNLDNVVENTTSAESAIRDTDMATQMVTYSNNNILAQAGQAMLAQANQSNQGVLSLLG